MERESKYLRAKERVENEKKFYNGLIAYIVTISFLAAINYYTNGFAYAWFLWAAFGWGIGVVVGAIKTFGVSPFFGRGWEERKIKQFMQEDEQRTRWE
ncbi:2TM domain-containing protein [Zobellia uliginosa]|uniref:2TM domain-containing protein n=1 Tax=Zobellia uliginosa TaxID=143224 RepID=UPI001C076661|nr:2TM domain-containing protein [Zobellia uliginosa]MBU2945951.1 2TM domain-containing protein [Zobellia uliginosa]